MRILVISMVLFSILLVIAALIVVIFGPVTSQLSRWKVINVRPIVLGEYPNEEYCCSCCGDKLNAIRGFKSKECPSCRTVITNNPEEEL